MIAQEVIMVCDMQAAQCIAQVSCPDEGTVAQWSQWLFEQMSFTITHKGDA